jgi:hypothetical protein
MAKNADESQGTQGLPPDDLQSENEFIKLKMMAEWGASFGGDTGALSPELENQFLQQVQAFESAFQAGSAKTFAESVGRPAVMPLPEFQQLPNAKQETMVNDVMAYYRQHAVDVCFEFEYPPVVKYQFLVEDLPERPNYFGVVQGMTVGVIYEEYYPNHGAVLETTTVDFMEGLSQLDIEQLKYTLAPVQVLPDGPYPTEYLLKALADKFQTIASLDDFEYSIMQTSYDLSLNDDEGEEQALQGLGYSEGLVKFTVMKKDGSSRQISGPFKFYFQLEYDCWAIMYIIFPGMGYPTLPAGS